MPYCLFQNFWTSFISLDDSQVELTNLKPLTLIKLFAAPFVLMTTKKYCHWPCFKFSRCNLSRLAFIKQSTWFLWTLIRVLLDTSNLTASIAVFNSPIDNDRQMVQCDLPCVRESDSSPVVFYFSTRGKRQARGGVSGKDEGKGEGEKTSSSTLPFSLPITHCSPLSVPRSCLARFPLSARWKIEDDWGRVSETTSWFLRQREQKSSEFRVNKTITCALHFKGATSRNFESFLWRPKLR